MSTVALSSDAVVGAIRARSSVDERIVMAFWVVTDGDREEFARELHSGAGELPLAALIVRGAAFDDPNMLLQDLAATIAQNKSTLTEERHSILRTSGKAILVLIARKSLEVPPTSSPVTLPMWFPVRPGEVHPVRIEDLTWQAREPLSSDAVHRANLCELLFELDGVILARLADVYEKNHNASSALRERLQKQTRSGQESVDDIILGGVKARREVKNPQSFRPSAGRSAFLVARIWRVVNETPPDSLGRFAGDLVSALGLKDEDCRGAESLIGVMGRGSNPDSSLATRYVRNVITSLRAACQLLTASAHADDYPSFPVNLIRGVSVDLRLTLEDAVVAWSPSGE